MPLNFCHISSELCREGVLESHLKPLDDDQSLAAPSVHKGHPRGRFEIEVADDARQHHTNREFKSVREGQRAHIRVGQGAQGGEVL